MLGPTAVWFLSLSLSLSLSLLSLSSLSLLSLSLLSLSLSECWSAPWLYSHSCMVPISLQDVGVLPGSPGQRLHQPAALRDLGSGLPDPRRHVARLAEPQVPQIGGVSHWTPNRGRHMQKLAHCT